MKKYALPLAVVGLVALLLGPARKSVSRVGGLALAALLIGQAALVGEWLTRMAANNEADAHRLEGQAGHRADALQALTDNAQ